MREYYLELAKIHQAQLLNIAEKRRLLKKATSGEIPRNGAWVQLFAKLSEILSGSGLKRKRRGARRKALGERPIAEVFECARQDDGEGRLGSESASFEYSNKTIQCSCTG